MDKNINKIKWHPAFVAATMLALKADRKHLEYQRELQLSKEPIKADLMIIKKEPGIRVKNQIGHI